MPPAGDHLFLTIARNVRYRCNLMRNFGRAQAVKSKAFVKKPVAATRTGAPIRLGSYDAKAAGQFCSQRRALIELSGSFA